MRLSLTGFVLMAIAGCSSPERSSAGDADWNAPAPRSVASIRDSVIAAMRDSIARLPHREAAAAPEWERFDSIVVISDSLFRATLALKHRVLPHVHDGFDSAVVTAFAPAYRLPCYRYARYAVTVIDTLAEGEDVIVREMPPLQQADSPRAGCGTDSLPGDFVVRNSWAAFFYGVRGSLLFIDNGTGDVRDLTLYDIPSRRRVLNLEGYDIAGWRDDGTLAVWLATGAVTTGCTPDPRLGGVRVDSLYELHLRSLKLTPTGDTHCSQLQ